MKQLNVRQAIVTKSCGSCHQRIKATAARGFCYFDKRDDLNREENHIEAAKKLIAKFVAQDKADYAQSYGKLNALQYDIEKNPWAQPFITGNLPNGDFVHVFNDDSNFQKLTVANVCDVAEILNNVRPHDMQVHSAQVIANAREAFGIKTN